MRSFGWTDSDEPVTGKELIGYLERYRLIGGRKEKPVKDLKTVVRQIRITPREERFLARIANLHQITVSDFILRRVFYRDLPKPQHGLNIEVSHLFNRIQESLGLIESCSREGSISTIDHELVSEMNNSIDHIGNQLDVVHTVTIPSATTRRA